MNHNYLRRLISAIAHGEYLSLKKQKKYYDHPPPHEVEGFKHIYVKWERNGDR
jgi:hypothetical protein